MHTVSEKLKMGMLRPATPEELGAALGQGRVRVAGSNSMPGLSGEAEETQVISMLRLNKVLGHDVAGRTIRVGAGISLEALQQALAWHNQWVPMDPPGVGGRKPGNRTIGGIVSTDCQGPLGLRRAWRHVATWGRWIDGRGEWHEGGISAAIGARGGAGVLAEVVLQVEERPADERMLVVFCDDAGEVEAVREAVMARERVAYLQVIGCKTFAGNPLDLPDGQMVLAIGAMGAEAAGEIEALRELLAGREMIAQRAAQAGRLRLWMTSEPAGTLAFRVFCDGSALGSMVARLEAIAAEEGAECWLVGEMGLGQLRGMWKGEWRGAIGRIGEAAISVGGKCALVWVSEGLSDSERAELVGAWGR